MRSNITLRTTSAHARTSYPTLYPSSNADTPHTLAATSPQANDEFGRAVSLCGTRAVVGAPRDDEGLQTDAGAAYVFRYTGASWELDGRLVASDGFQNDQFGRAVAADSICQVKRLWRSLFSRTSGHFPVAFHRQAAQSLWKVSVVQILSLWGIPCYSRPGS